MKKYIFSTLVASLLAGTTLSAFPFFDVDIDQAIAHNKALIKQYEANIKALQEQNKKMLEAKKKHPELYVKKPLFENLKDKYIYRIKLNGAEPDKLNFMIKDNVVSLSMDMKKEEKTNDGYFYSSEYFSTSYAIPKDVQQDKIEHKVEGDYFTIIMPKKK
ncbi:hypothetical protein MNB_SM-3-242 [hydrothermal vent metagenome]|uniref:SHSP domain-containing protein n=1 Tax=hydrothermal vent metagenome TaxID=652676 RepID=A0A1W1D3I1_9ZZZZ